MRTEHELLHLVVAELKEAQNLSGLCGLLNYMSCDDVITIDEYHLLLGMIKEHKPKVNRPWILVLFLGDGIGFWWRKGWKYPRRMFLNKLLKYYE